MEMGNRDSDGEKEYMLCIYISKKEFNLYGILWTLIVTCLGSGHVITLGLHSAVGLIFSWAGSHCWLLATVTYQGQRVKSNRQRAASGPHLSCRHPTSHRAQASVSF